MVNTSNYCKTNEHSYLYMVREYLSIIIVKQMNTVTHGMRILIQYYCKTNEHRY